MALKRFHYKVDGEFRFIPPLGSGNKGDLVYLGSEDWKAGRRKGRFDKYVVAPGFYVEIFLGINEPSTVDIITEEDKENEFRLNLENRLKVKLQLR
jgi:hypothetical protein